MEKRHMDVPGKSPGLGRLSSLPKAMTNTRHCRRQWMTWPALFLSSLLERALEWGEFLCIILSKKVGKTSEHFFWLCKDKLHVSRLFFRNDPRLNFDHMFNESSTLSSVSGGLEGINPWTPQYWFPNALNNPLGSLNKDEQGMELHSNGDVR